MGKQPMMGGHSSVMLSRLMDCYVFYRSIPPGYMYCTFFIYTSAQCQVLIERTNVQLR